MNGSAPAASAGQPARRTTARRARGRTTTVRLALVAAFLATLFAGRLWGTSGRWELDRARRDAAVRADLLEAHASLPGARVSLCHADGAPRAHGPTSPVKISEKP